MSLASLSKSFLTFWCILFNLSIKPYLFDHPNFPEILISPEHLDKSAKLDEEKKKKGERTIFSLFNEFICWRSTHRFAINVKLASEIS